MSLPNFAFSADVPRRYRAAFSCGAVSVFGLALLFAGGCGPKEGAAPADTTTTTTTTTASPAADATGVAPGPAAANGKKLRLAFVTNNASDYWTIAKKGTEKAQAELPNVTVDYEVPSEGTAADQKRVVDDLLAKGVDGVAISPVDPANQTDMLNGIAAKAVLVTQDSDAPASKRMCYIGTDNVAAGHMEGKLIKEAIPKGGKIMLFVGKKDAKNAQERAQGITEELKGSNVSIIDTKTDDTDHLKAKTNVSETLIRYPDVAGLVGLWSYNGPAILSAVTEAGKVGKVKIICFDEEDDTLKGVKAGSIYGTVVQQPYEFGYQSITDMNKYLGGDKTIFPASGKMIIPTKPIKQADVDPYKAKLDQLRGRAKA